MRRREEGSCANAADGAVAAIASPALARGHREKAYT
jgi:hypothetical protein